MDDRILYCLAETRRNLKHRFWCKQKLFCNTILSHYVVVLSQVWAAAASINAHYNYSDQGPGRCLANFCTFSNVLWTQQHCQLVTMSNRHSSSSIGYQSNRESRTSYVFWCATFISVRLHNIWVTVSPRSLHLGTGTDSDRVTRLTTYCWEHAPSLANVVSTTLVRPPGTLCHLTYMTLLTLTHSRNDLKLFCLIVRTDLLLLLYGAPGRFVERRLTNLSLYLYLYL